MQLDNNTGPHHVTVKSHLAATNVEKKGGMTRIKSETTGLPLAQGVAVSSRGEKLQVKALLFSPLDGGKHNRIRGCIRSRAVWPCEMAS